MGISYSPFVFIGGGPADVQLTLSDSSTLPGVRILPKRNLLHLGNTFDLLFCFRVFSKNHSKYLLAVLWPSTRKTLLSARSTAISSSIRWTKRVKMGRSSRGA